MQHILDRLIGLGSEVARVHCPIGLAIGADTPEEIVLSIMAELVQVRSGMNE